MRHGCVQAAIVVLLGLPLPGGGASRELGQSAENTDTVLRSTTRMVQVNVVVRDKQGHPVTDLTQDDFTVQENGKTQQIAHYSVESKDKSPAPAAPLPPNIFTNHLERREGVPNHVTVILLDGLNTRWGDQIMAAREVGAFLQQIRPGDRVALFGLSRNLRVLHDYTSDPGALAEALARWQGLSDNLLRISEQASEPSSPSGAALGGLLAFMQEEVSFAQEMRVLTTLRALEAIANHVARIPGRKNLVWVSAGFPITLGFLPGYERGWSPASAPSRVRGLPWRADAQTRALEAAEQTNQVQRLFGRNPMTFTEDVNRAVRALNNADLAVYGVDARGLVVQSSAWAKAGTMKELAERTGGRAYYNRNDIRNSIREAVTDASHSYLLAYYPREQQGNGGFRKIKVKVKRPDVVVRYRNGYLDDEQMAGTDPAARRAELLNAAWSPVDATPVRLEARVSEANGRLQVETIVDPQSVTLKPRGGRWQGAIDVLEVQRDTRGNALDPRFRTVPIDLAEDEYRHAQTSGMILRETVERRQEAAALRIVVRDLATGNVGSLTVPYARIAGPAGATR